MNVRLAIAAVLLVMAVPVGLAYQSLNVEPPEARLFGFLGYLLVTAYLIATGFRIPVNR